MRQISVILFLTYSVCCLSQTTDKFIDPRDGRRSNIERIDSTWWFADNLKFETAGSHCPNVSSKNCSEANFYPYTELDEVCPTGWHVSTLEEWQAFVANRQKATGLDSLTVDTFEDEDLNEGFVALSDYTQNLQMFSEEAPLNLKGIGWIEGKRKTRLNTITIWAIHSTADNDRKYHLHIGSNSYVGHLHDHNIIDKPKRVRKFAVRCVKE